MLSTCNVNEAISIGNTGEPWFRDGIFNVSKELPEFHLRFGGNLVECSDRVLDVFSRAVNNPRSKEDIQAILIELLNMNISKGRSTGGNQKEHRFQIVVTGMGVDKVYTLRAVCGRCDGYGPVLTFLLADE
jgi:hypothetical protein